LERCPDNGIIRFKRSVGLAVLSGNLQILGAKLQKQAVKKMQRKKELLQDHAVLPLSF
jgi:hypothetical protein